MTATAKSNAPPDATPTPAENWPARSTPDDGSEMTPLGGDPRDSSIPASTIKQLAMLRRIDRASFDAQLTYQRAAVDRQVAAETRTRANADRRAMRYLTIDVGLSQDDAREVAAVMAEQRCDAPTAAVLIGQRRAAK